MSVIDRAIGIDFSGAETSAWRRELCRRWPLGSLCNSIARTGCEHSSAKRFTRLGLLIHRPYRGRRGALGTIVRRETLSVRAIFPRKNRQRCSNYQRFTESRGTLTSI